MSHKKVSQQTAFPGSNRHFGAGGMNRFAPVPKAKDRRSVLKKLMRLYLKEGRQLLIVLLFLLGSGILLLSIPALVGRAINSINVVQSGHIDYHFITVIGLSILSLYVLDWLFSTLQSWIMTGASQKIVYSLRKILFDKMQKLPLTFHDTHSHGELMSHITNDIDNISSTIAASTSQLMSSVINVLGSLTFMIILSPLLSLVTLATMPLVVIITKIAAKKSRRMFIGQQKELGELNGIIEETISGLRMVKAFNQEERVVSQFQSINKNLQYHSTKAQIWSGFLMPLLNVITNLGNALIAGVGGIMAVNGMIAVGTIASFVTYSRFFIRPLNDIASTFNSIQSALAGAERVFDVLEQEEEKQDDDHAIEMVHPKGEVTFENVSFEYVKGVRVLKDVCFHVEKGQTVAFVGETGAGKTTIVNLLTRFYDTTDGSILIDGVDIKKYSRESLRHTFTVVLQDTCLFTGTILENIRYGKPGAAEEEVIRAAVLANSDSFIRRLPQGYHTKVSGSVDSLSQGQRQLIAIARAVLCSAPILILDEATSNVDTRTEMQIQDAIMNFRKDRTAFFIAHRLSTIKNADHIMVVNQGAIVESGTHNELIDLDGVYAGMYNIQFKEKEPQG